MIDLEREGPLDPRDATGMVAVRPEKGTVTLEVMAFGRATPIDLERWKVEK